MNNTTNIYDIDGELLRAAGDNEELTIEKAQERLKMYEEKVKELAEKEEVTDEEKKKIAVYNDYIKNLASYIITNLNKMPQKPVFKTSEELGIKEQIEKAMKELEEEAAKEEAEEVAPGEPVEEKVTTQEETIMDEYVPFVEVSDEDEKEPLPFSEIDKVIGV